MSLAVEQRHSFELFVKAQFLVDIFLVQTNENGSTYDCVKSKNNAWDRCHNANLLLEESEKSHGGKANANEVWLNYIECQAGLEQELKESHTVKGQED